MTRALLLAALWLWLPEARADSLQLRLATVVPDGTAWAREQRAFSRDLERATGGRVRARWYFGSVAGDELEVGERIRRGQLDGAGSGGPLCAQAMPSMGVLQIPGLFQDAAEARYVLRLLSATLAAEAEQSGWVYLTSSALGSGVVFSRHPIHSMAELRATRLWAWSAETTLISLLGEMGLSLAPAPLDRALREFEQGRSDGFLALPAAALAFQWSVAAPYLVDLRSEHLIACLLLDGRAWTRLSAEDQRILQAATARLTVRFDDVSRELERALLSGLFQHQGVQVLQPSEKFRAEFFAAANAARDRKASQLLPPALLQRVRGMLSDYRAQHPAGTAP